MGCDIHIQAEYKIKGKWEIVPDIVPFNWRSYGMFGFLANVRNYSAIHPLSEPRGLPEDYVGAGDEEFSGWLGDHSHSWFSVEELLAFNYDLAVEDRRYTRQEGSNFFNRAATTEPGQGKMTTYREFLGQAFFDDLEKLKAVGAERVVFGFDS